MFEPVVDPRLPFARPEIAGPTGRESASPARQPSSRSDNPHRIQDPAGIGHALIDQLQDLRALR